MAILLFADGSPFQNFWVNLFGSPPIPTCIGARPFGKIDIWKFCMLFYYKLEVSLPFLSCCFLLTWSGTACFTDTPLKFKPGERTSAGLIHVWQTKVKRTIALSAFSFKWMTLHRYWQAIVSGLTSNTQLGQSHKRQWLDDWVAHLLGAKKWGHQNC